MKKIIPLIIFVFGIVNCEAKTETLNQKKEVMLTDKQETAVFGAGCFWCVEAVFQTLKGVYAVEPGYTGGSTKNPSYYDVTTGTTGHAEVARITFNPDEVSFEFLLSVFFQTHDPTTLNYQGADMGTQYRSAIFYTSDEQKLMAEKIISELDDAQAYPNKIVTEVTALKKFYLAEDYHRNYYLNNKDQAYCKFVIQPKMEKFKKVFKDYLK
ncbi:MAG: peptide-methionine (S)-S-oxide reductase [Bacteroidetes bacterium HGW-Bacteroidetes-17]|nr:MAG: peptide-methionine (S)-S-oxide reductase [Bacteroidetes bacterium HGW-Bacteroidetes-17]